MCAENIIIINFIIFVDNSTTPTPAAAPAISSSTATAKLSGECSTLHCLFTAPFANLPCHMDLRFLIVDFGRYLGRLGLVGTTFAAAIAGLVAAVGGFSVGFGLHRVAWGLRS